MPRDSNGTYSLPAVYLAVTGQTVLAQQHNTPLQDIAAALTGSLPRNGTGSMLDNLPMGGYKITNLSPGDASTDAATYGQLSSLIPFGVIWETAATTAPAGWLLCYGQAVSRSTYADLFSAIGTTYGVGDGSTTFNIPDLRGRVSAGKDDMGGTSANRLTNQPGGLNGDTLGATGGSETHALITGELPVHTHAAGTLATSSAGNHSHTLPDATSNSGSQGGAGNSPLGTISTSTAGAHTHTITGATASAGSGTAHNNLPPTIILNKIIKALA